MLGALDLIPVEPEDLVLGEPLPYDVYDRVGRLMMVKGQMLTRHKIRDLLRSGWRLQPGGPRVETAAPEAAPAPPPRPLRVRRRPLTEARALIAEDMKLSQKLLLNMLNQQRIFNIETADDGASAVKKFRAGHFDLVFLDIDMPVMDGLAALADIRAADAEVFICLVSANSTRVNVHKAKELGVDGFLVKPISGLNIARVLALYNKTTTEAPVLARG